MFRVVWGSSHTILGLGFGIFGLGLGLRTFICSRALGVGYDWPLRSGLRSKIFGLRFGV